jgi:hypothetical protein
MTLLLSQRLHRCFLQKEHKLDVLYQGTTSVVPQMPQKRSQALAPEGNISDSGRKRGRRC